MKEENKILQDMNKTNPFKVPEGYFDNLTRRVMDSLPEQENISRIPKKKAIVTTMTKWFSAAAAVVVLLLCIKIFVPDTTENTVPNAAATAKEEAPEQDFVSEEEYEIEVMRYAMIDREDIYSYLEGAE